MEWLYLTIIVLLNTLIWPLSRWVVKNEGDSTVYGFWLYLSGTFAALMTLTVTEKLFDIGYTWVFGIMAGLSNAVSFILIMYCLKIGPTSLTSLIINMSLIWPVMIEVIFLKGAVNWLLIAGIISILIGMIFIAVIGNKHDFKEQNTKMRWLIFIIIGWILSGISYSSQVLNNYFEPNNVLQYILIMCLVSSILLFSYSIFKKIQLTRKYYELKAGIVYGVFFNITVLLSFLSLQVSNPAVVFSVSISGPIVIMLFIGNLFYGEKIRFIGLVGSLLIISGIMLLGLR